MSVGVGLCRNVGRSDVFVVEFFSCLSFSLNTPLSLHKLTFFMNSQAHSFSLQTHPHFLQQTQQGTDLGLGGAIGVM